MMPNLNHRLMRPLLAAFVGALTTLAFAPYQIWPLAILSPAILFLLIHQLSTRLALLCGFCWGIGHYATGLSWVHVSIDNFGGMPKAASIFLMVLLISYLAVYPALFAGAANRFFTKSSASKYFLAIPALWLISDWARGWVFTGFPWLWLGYSQIDTPLAGFAPVGGVQLITLAVILCASALAYGLLNKKLSMLALPVIIFASAASLKQVEWVEQNPQSKTSFALIQGNIAQEIKWLPSERWPTLMKFMDLSRENWDADIIIWPEAAIPALEKELPRFLSNVDAAARLNESALITGVISQNEMGKFYNSVITLGDTPDGEYDYLSQHRYNKHHLLPFGEFVPFEDLLRPLAPFFNLPMSSFSRGDYIQDNIIAKGRHLATALCYEIIFGNQVRQNITEETDFILTLSNDAWFGHSIGPLQHMEIARMRALETAKPVIRATNNGVTAVTDYKGNVTESVPQFETQVLKAEVTSTVGSTPFRKIGSWPLIIFTLLGLGLALIDRRKG
ncbi:apolipoprotein N-acyltransferase [Vibrio sp. JC009]|uniref:apolipoprotein N-acyltransferase n=1 Tax=Vibrio sp. JC009 TaxID=2912314 RepID=UPI0023AE7BA2|nr:apolipoprotein N-acyltransferase [Vibrio sp. JC009]WED22497.1 apolipoprotein N-acyltransferase [Vibrio sp. JC009]